MNIWGMSLVALGYVLFYYGVDIMVHAYASPAGTILNPPPLTVLLGVPGAPTSSGASGNGSTGSASNPGISDNLNVPNPLTGSSGQ